MSDRLKVFVDNIGRYVDIDGGETVGGILSRLRTGPAGESLGLDFDPLCALVNNKVEDLSFPVFSPKRIEYLSRDDMASRRVYARSLVMMLYKAVTVLWPGAVLRMEHSVAGGCYFRIVSDEPVACDEGNARALTGELRRLSDADLPFVRKERLTEDVIRQMERQGLRDKVLLLESCSELYTVFYRLDGLDDCYPGALAPSTGYIRYFDVRPYKEGFMLLGADESMSGVAAGREQEKMYGAFTDYLKFNRVIKVSTVGELNRAVRERRVPDLINVAEAMHGKQLSAIAEEIARRRGDGGARFVLVAGPSSSGKTTSAKRLGIQLMTNLITPKIISLDDYFIDRDRTPRDERGDYDFESLYALDLELLNSHLQSLMRGETVNLPTYSFELGRRVERERPLRLDDDDVLVIEGIHGLNPDLTSRIPQDQVFKVYVSALTTLHIDDHNWISTSDTRLLRRIVRDYKYRGTPAIESIRRWPSVGRGERKWIFPYQENADAMFNSSLLFEIGVIKSYAEPLLREVPRSRREYSEAHRLLRLLQYFAVIDAVQIPPTSLLREFVGGSSLKY